MQVAFKVVMKWHRFGTNAALYTSDSYNRIYSPKYMKYFKYLLDAYPTLKPYFPRYSKNTVVKAVPGSVGLMAFSSKLEAEDFIFCELRGMSTAYIVKLLYTKADILNPPMRIIGNCGGRIMNLLDLDLGYSSRPVPEGTIFLSKATVLD